MTRYLAILSLIGGASRALSVREVYRRLREDHPANERTYRRDLENLEYLGYLQLADGFPRGDTPDARAGRFKPGRLLSAGNCLRFNRAELFAFHLARKMVTPLRDTALGGDLEQVFDRVERGIPDRSREHLAELSQLVTFNDGPRWAVGLDASTLEVIRKACEEGHVLTARYRSLNSGKERERTLGPQFLYFSNDSLYLVAEDLEDSVIKVFSVARLSEASMTEEAYLGRRVDPETYFRSALGVFRGDCIERIELEFTGIYSEFVRERRWHASQRNQVLMDGRLRMTLELAVTPELVDWVMGFSDGIRVIGPATLRDQVLEKARQLLQINQVPA